MEIELKYAISDKTIAERIWQDPYLLSLEEEDSREKVSMKAVYFDTGDCILSKNDIAFRVRIEGGKAIASLKWNGKNVGPLYTREEINVPIDGEACLIMPDPHIFRESDIGASLIKLIEGKELSSIMEVRFLRSRVRVDTGVSIIEVSVDIGEIATDLGTRPICEVELELFSGEQEDLLELGEKLVAQYDLMPECRSKYARGLELIGKL